MNKDDQPICKTDLFGTKRWRLNNQLHREDGPAIELANGHKSWYFRGQLHRLDGPAMEFANGEKHWYFHGELINCSSQEEFKRLINLIILR